MDAIKTAKVWIGERKGITSPLHVSQYDTGWTFEFTVYKDDVIYTSANTVTVVFEGLKSDGTTFAAPGTFADGVVTVETTVAMTSAAGIVECELRLSEGGETVGTGNFDMVVEPSPIEEGTPSESDYTTLQTMVDEVSELYGETVDAAAAAESAADAAAAELVEEVPDLVWDWLDMYISPETGYAIDSSLTVQGAAADAKTVGDRLEAVEPVKDKVDKALFPETFEALGKEYYAASIFSSGSISATGSEVSDNTSVKSVYFEVARVRAAQIPLGYKAKFCWYSAIASSAFISKDANYQKCGDLNYVNAPSSAAYFRLLLVNDSGSEITSSAITELNSSILLYSDGRNVADAAALPDLIRKAYNTQIPARASSAYFSIIKGSMISRTGASSNDDKYARTQIMTMSAPSFLLDFPSAYAANISFFTQSTISATYFISKQTLRYNSGGYLIHKPDNAACIVVEFHRKDWQALTDTDVSTLSNNFAIFVSEIKTRGAVTQDSAREAFGDYMAQMCEKLGMDDSYFANPSGLTSESYTTPADELKLGVAVAGNPLALDIWSTKDRDFTIGGPNRRTVSIVNNVYGAQPASADYKLLGGKGGSLLAETGGGEKRKAHIGLYDVNDQPVIMALLCAGDWAYDNITNCAQELAGMMENTMSGNQVTPGEYITHLLTDGGGYAAAPVPVCAGAYLNAFSADDMLTRENALFGNASVSQMPASTTKTLTMLCALSVLSDLQETVQLVAGDISSGSGTTFSAGDTVTAEEALRIMMMESSNTMALAIGRFVGTKLLRADEAKG